MCVHCKEILRESFGGTQWWLLIEEFVAHQPHRVSDGLCPNCLAKHYSGPTIDDLTVTTPVFQIQAAESLATPKASPVSWGKSAIRECRLKNGATPDVKGNVDRYSEYAEFTTSSLKVTIVFLSVFRSLTMYDRNA
jgi:hypothetical protein